MGVVWLAVAICERGRVPTACERKEREERARGEGGVERCLSLMARIDVGGEIEGSQAFLAVLLLSS